MATGRGVARRGLHTLFSGGAVGGLSDGELLERFTSADGEAGGLAFAVLVERHGPTVLRVCRALLRDEHDAQDAFQATFLVLARRGAPPRSGDSLAPWLYGVARRVARSAQSAEARRRRHERKAAESARSWSWGEAPGGRDLERVLYEEVGRLPARDRAPVVLCLLEGLSHEQAARQLGWPLGTVKSRLAHGRARLRARLTRRGLTPEAVLSTAGPLRVRLPASLAGSTTRAAVRYVAGGGAAGAVPAAVASLAAGAQRSRVMFKACFAALAVLTFGAFGVPPGPAVGPPVSGVEFTFVDLQPKGNHRLADPLGDLPRNDLAQVPQGPQRLGGTWFRVGERLIRVRGERSPEPPKAVRGIEVAAAFDTLHVLHSTMFGNAFGVADGAEIGAYVVHYADRTEARVPILYGVDMRDWWRSSDPDSPSRGKVAWAGRNGALEDGDEVRLFTSEWTNPHPEKTVTSIDFETSDTPAAPFLVALTLEHGLDRTGAAGR